MRRNRRNPLVLLCLLFLACLVIGFFSFQWYTAYLKSPLDPNGKIKIFVINPNEQTKDIATRLEKEGIIRSARAFLQELKKHDDSKIKTGDFKLSPAMNVTEVIDNLEKGSVDARITLLEGWRVEEMAEKLEKEMGLQQELVQMLVLV